MPDLLPYRTNTWAVLMENRVFYEKKIRFSIFYIFRILNYWWFQWCKNYDCILTTYLYFQSNANWCHVVQTFVLLNMNKLFWVAYLISIPGRWYYFSDRACDMVDDIYQIILAISKHAATVYLINGFIVCDDYTMKGTLLIIEFHSCIFSVSILSHEYFRLFRRWI